MVRRFTFAALAAASLSGSASAAGQPKTLEELFAPLSIGACVRINDVRAISATVQLTPEQFQFVRALWIAMPPVSRDLPPGSKAFLAKDATGDAVFGLVDDDGEICAVFKSEDWMERLVDQVGLGETGKRGQAM